METDGIAAYGAYIRAHYSVDNLSIPVRVKPKRVCWYWVIDIGVWVLLTIVLVSNIVGMTQWHTLSTLYKLLTLTGTVLLVVLVSAWCIWRRMLYTYLHSV